MHIEVGSGIAVHIRLPGDLKATMSPGLSKAATNQDGKVLNGEITLILLIPFSAVRWVYRKLGMLGGWRA